MALTYIWVSFFVLSFIYGIVRLFNGDVDIFTKMVGAIFSNSKGAFEIALFLTGILSLWSGIMHIAEQSGLINKLAKLISPLFCRLFPDLPKNHPAMGAVFMNFSANMLGLDNAATPLGLKAMQGLQAANTKPQGVASDAQIMFLVLNTSGLTIIPISIMMFRAQAHAASPSDIFLPTLIATSIATLSALFITALFQKVIFDKFLILFLAGAISIIGGAIFFFSSLPTETITTISSLVSNLFLLFIITTILVIGVIKKLNVYESFIDGAKDGFSTSIKIVPHLVGMLVGIALFRESGFMDVILSGLSWGLNSVGLGDDHITALPVALMRPLSGSGSRGLMLDIFQTYGVDSFAAKLASVMQGSSDTTFYILAVYFGSVGINKPRHALFCGLLADFIGFIASVFLCYIFFSN